jgi:hypothetical protein
VLRRCGSTKAEESGGAGAGEARERVADVWERAHERAAGSWSGVPTTEHPRLYGMAMERFQREREAQSRSLRRALLGVILFVIWQFVSSESGHGM